MNWNATCAAASAPKSEAMPTSGAIWWRCARPGSRRAIRPRRGGRASGEREGGRNGTRKKHFTALSYSFPRHAVERRAFRTRCQSANHCERARCSNPKPRLCLRCSAEGYARCEAVKAGLRCLGSDVQECHLQNRPISRSGGKGGKTEIDDALRIVMRGADKEDRGAAA